jgi:hypothetical protein
MYLALDEMSLRLCMGMVRAEGASIVISCGNIFWLGLTLTLTVSGMQWEALQGF